MNRRWWIVWGGAAFVVMAAMYWHFAGPITVAVVSPHRGAAVDAIYATGTVEPTVMLPIAPRVAGRIVALLTDEGREVRKGTALARLESRDLESTVEELAARARYAHADFARQQSLVARGVGAAVDLDRSRADAQAADAALARARAERDFMVLAAPAAGRIIRRDGEVGQFIPVGQPIFYLSCCAPLRVSADVDEEDVSRVRVGMKVVLRADAIPNRTFDGAVIQVTPKGDPVARTYRVRIGLVQPEMFQVGMTVDSNLIVAVREQALLVPSTSVSNGAVWVIRDGRIARQPVTVGIASAEQIEILAGLNPDSVVVASPAPELREGRRAHIHRPAAPPGFR